jgi:hypothetical protein
MQGIQDGYEIEARIAEIFRASSLEIHVVLAADTFSRRGDRSIMEIDTQEAGLGGSRPP